jgi:hypothetical protein
VAVGLAGALLTLLFWTRASLGVPAVWLGDVGQKLGALLGGWPWPGPAAGGALGRHVAIPGVRWPRLPRRGPRYGHPA